MTTPHVTLSCRHFRSLRALLPHAALALATSPAFAQLEKVNTTLTVIQTMLVGIAVIVITIAVMWAGYKMVFQHSRWSEISNIVIGGILIGAAPAIAAWLAGA